MNEYKPNRSDPPPSYWNDHWTRTAEEAGFTRRTWHGEGLEWEETTIVDGRRFRYVATAYHKADAVTTVRARSRRVLRRREDRATRRWRRGKLLR